MKRKELIRLMYISGYCLDYRCRPTTSNECRECCNKELTEYENEIYNKALDDLLEKMNPCAICPSYPNECNNRRYFENCYVAENSMSYEKLKQTIEKLKKGKE